MNHIPDAAFEEHCTIVGKTGSGKTFTAKLLVERMLDAGRRVCILDPTGAWHGLKSNAAGDGPGFNIAVFGGDHGDLPITEVQAEPLARIIAQENLPAVIDLSLFSTSARRRFATHFMEALYHHNRAALHLVVDEADEFGPQKVQPDQTTLLNRFDQIVRRGRVKGFRVMMITQRPAVLNKDLLSMSAMLIAMKLMSPQDRNALAAWIEGQADRVKGKEIIDSLPQLERGQGWVWWPEGNLLELMTFPRIFTFDSSRTPAAGETILVPTGLAQIDLSAFQAALGEVESGLKPTRTRVETAPAVDLDAIQKEAWADGHATGFAAGRAAGWSVAQDAVREALGEFLGGASVPILTESPPCRGFSTELSARPKAEIAAQEARKNIPENTPAPSAAASISPMSRKIIDTIHAAYPMSLTFAAAAARAGASKKSSQFSLYRRQVDQAGELELRDGRYRSAAPTALAGQGRTGPEAVSEWAAKLTPSCGAMLRAIARHGPLFKDEVAAHAAISPTSSGLGSGLRELIELDLIIRHDSGLFEIAEGLR